MNLTLNIRDKLGAALNVGNITVGSGTITLDNATTDSLAGLSLAIGNTYTIVMPADAAAPTATVTITSPQDGTLNHTTSAGELAAGVSIPIVPASVITQLDFSVLSAAENYSQTVTVTAEDITVRITENASTTTYTGQDLITQTIPDNSSTRIEVDVPGHYSYDNTVTFYTQDQNITVRMVDIITDPLDPEYREPFPYFFFILEPCSYDVHIYNAQSAPFGDVSYEENGTQFSVGSWNTVFSSCQADTLSITQRIIVDEAAGACGNPTAILFNKIFTINGIIVTEFKPNLSLNHAFECCFNLAEAIGVFPTSLNLFFAPPIDDCLDMELRYVVVSPSGATVVDVTHDHTALTTFSDLSDLNFILTPTELGTYVLTTTIKNCCTTTTYTTNIEVCYPYTVAKADCNIVKITNHSNGANSGSNNVVLTPITYTLKKYDDTSKSFTILTIGDVLQEDITVLQNTFVDVNVVEDGVYTVEITWRGLVKDFVFVLDCNIQACKKTLLLNYLCGKEAATNCEPCVTHERWLKFKTMEDLLYHKWDEWKQEQTLTEILNIGNFLTDALYANDLIKAMLKLCNECGCTTDTHTTSTLGADNGTDCGC